MRTILKMGDGTPAPVLVLVVLVFAVASLAACSSGVGARRSGRIRVVAAENFWGSIAKQIAGGAADVSSVISNPATDPHDYEPTAEDARAIAESSFVIENGVGYDPWMRQLVDADGSARPAVLDVGKLLGVPDGANPHQWYSRAAVGRVITRVAADLEAADPKHRSVYERNERELVDSGFAKYDALIAHIRATYSGTPIGASESVVAPLAETLGLDLVTPRKFLDAVAEGNDPAASDKATVDRQIQAHRIKVLVFNRQNSTPDVQRLVDEARRARIPVATITETLTPANVTFQAWQVTELGALARALAQATGR
jgi:zinc/manganese transport system substrate-binding protein